MRDQEPLKGRRRHSEVWMASNPRLPDGHIGQEIDTGKIKVGDGSTRWNDLSYLGADLGASGPISIAVPVAFDTPNILTGITLANVADGDLVVILNWGVKTAWNGTTPNGYYYLGADPVLDDGISQDLTIADSTFGHWASLQIAPALQTFRVDGAQVLKAQVNDGAGGNPGSTAGAGVIYALILPATA